MLAVTEGGGGRSRWGGVTEMEVAKTDGREGIE